MTKSKRVKTRKPHPCWGCARVFPAGSMLERVTTIENSIDGFWTGYWCKVCHAVWPKWDRFYEIDPCGLGDLKDGDPDDWEATRLRVEGAVALEKTVKADIEIGESTAAKKHGLQQWWWRMEVKGCTIDSDKSDYRSKRTAERDARAMARRLHLDVESVRECGKEVDT